MEQDSNPSYFPRAHFGYVENNGALQVRDHSHLRGLSFCGLYVRRDQLYVAPKSLYFQHTVAWWLGMSLPFVSEFELKLEFSTVFT